MTGGFLQGLTADQQASLSALSTKRRFPKGSTLLSEGDLSGRVMLLSSGLVKICNFTADGKEVVLELRGPGQVLGELAAIDGQPISASVLALEEVEVLVLSAKDFKNFLFESPGAAVALLEMTVARLREGDRRRAEFGALDAVTRVAARLVEMADRFGEETSDGTRITVPLSQEELAGWIGASRESVTKALQALRSRGLIETHRRGITVLDIDKLRLRST